MLPVIESVQFTTVVAREEREFIMFIYFIIISQNCTLCTNSFTKDNSIPQIVKIQRAFFLHYCSTDIGIFICDCFYFKNVKKKNMIPMCRRVVVIGRSMLVLVKILCPCLCPQYVISVISQVNRKFPFVFFLNFTFQNNYFKQSGTIKSAARNLDNLYKILYKKKDFALASGLKTLKKLIKMLVSLDYSDKMFRTNQMFD